MSVGANVFGSLFAKFSGTALEKIRLETYGEDIGQFCWLTADEYRRFFEWLHLGPNSTVLDVASGSGGPALFMASLTGARVMGIDINEHAITTARKMAEATELSSLVRFEHADANQGFPFDEDRFDAVVCIDSIHHLLDRRHVLGECYRLLKPSGRILYTDSHVITGILTLEQITTRANLAAHFDFTPPGENERLIQEAGFDMEVSQDVTDNVVELSKRWREARERYRDEAIPIEGKEDFEALQRFLLATHRLSVEKRLSRLVFVARKPS
jgi:ubiquinone/menaquinone biosynthesis C-methylase UbiE